MRTTISQFAMLAVVLGVNAQAELAEKTRASIDELTGAKGVYTAEEDVHRVSFPRSDLKVTIEGRPAHPFMGFGSWAAFTPGHGGTIVMGDIVLLEDEVSPAMSVALDAGLEVTALHNHFFYESPRVMYMHIGGTGNLQTLAPAVKKVLDRVAAVRSAAPTPPAKFAGPAVPDTSSITAADLDAIF